MIALPLQLSGEEQRWNVCIGSHPPKSAPRTPAAFAQPHIGASVPIGAELQHNLSSLTRQGCTELLRTRCNHFITITHKTLLPR